MFNKFLLSALLFISLQSVVTAQKVKKEVTTIKTPQEKIIEKKLVAKLYSPSQFINETSLFIKQPTKWKGSDWLKLGIVSAVTVSIMPFDERITNSTQGQQRYYHSFFVEGGRIYGDWYSIGGLAVGFGVYGLIARDTSTKMIAIELLQAGIYAYTITEMLKAVIGRERPSYTNNSSTYKPFTLYNKYNSMPSGHTTSAMALSTVMSRHVNSTALKILAYVPAAFTMFSRIYQHQHWLSDEIPGAAVGYFVGNWVVDLHEGKRHRIHVISVDPITISISLDKRSVQKYMNLRNMNKSPRGNNAGVLKK